MKRHFIVSNKYYPAVEVPMSITHATAHVPYSYAYLCPVCGEVWARSGVEHPQSRWHSLQRACRNHAEGLEVPGSIWQSWEPEFNTSLPPELLRAELELHLAFWSRIREADICLP